MKRIVHGSRLKGSNGQKITNNTNIFGIMGGLAPMKNISAATHRSYRIGHARVHQDIPLDPEKGLEYMLGDNPMGKYLLSKNPQCAGGVGKMTILATRGAYSKSTRSGGKLMSGSLYDDNSFGDDYDDVNCGTCALSKDDSSFNVRAWYKGLNVTNCGDDAANHYCYKSPTWATDCFHFRGQTCTAPGVCTGANVVYMLDQMFSPGYLDAIEGGFGCKIPAPTAPPSCDLGYDSRYYDALHLPPAQDKNGNQYPTPIEDNQKNWLVLGGGGTDWTTQILKSLVTGGSVDDFTSQEYWTDKDHDVLKKLNNKTELWTNLNTFVPTKRGSLADATSYYKFNQSVINNVNSPHNSLSFKTIVKSGIEMLEQPVQTIMTTSGLEYEEGYKRFDTNGEMILELSDDTTITKSPMLELVKALGYYGIIFDFEYSSTWPTSSTSGFLLNIFKTIKNNGLKVGVTCMQAKDFAGDFWNDVSKKDAPFFGLYDSEHGRDLFSHIDLISPQYYTGDDIPSDPTPDDYLNFQFIQKHYLHNKRKDGITIIPTILSCGNYDNWEDVMKRLDKSHVLSYDGYAIWNPSCSNTPITTRYKCNNGNCVPQKGGGYPTISACQSACGGGGGGGGGGGCPASCDPGYVCAKWWPTNPCSCIRQDSSPPFPCGDTPSKKYSCKNNCKEDPYGSYSSQSECTAACTMYACKNGFCQQDPNGKFNNADECLNSGCGKGPAPQKWWGCDQGTGACTKSSSGTFITQLDCESKCGGGGTNPCTSVQCGNPDTGPCYNATNRVCYGTLPDGSCPPGTTKCP